MYRCNLIIVAMLVWAFSGAEAQNQSNTPVIVATAQQQDFANVVEALGTLKANKSVIITSTVTESISAIHFTDGQRVAEGDLLFSMDTTDEAALLLEEEARLGEAQRQVKRLQPLAAQNATSKRALDTQRSAVSVAEARIRGIQCQIDKRQIKAPFDGLVGLLDISVGALSQPGVQLATLDQDDTMKMDFSVPERHLAHLRPGLKITATTQAYPDQSFIGEIATINSRINPVIRSVVVRAILENDDQQLKPGMLMRIKLDTQPRTALLIPEEAIISNAQQQFLFVVNQANVIECKSVKIGTRQSGKIEILGGLNAGEQVVIHGTLRIKPGDQVEVIATKQDDESLTELLAQRTKQTTSGS